MRGRAVAANLPSTNGKRRLEQELLKRGSRDFESVEAWQRFVDDVARKLNAGRGSHVAEELAVMRALDVGKLPEHVEEEAWVCALCGAQLRGFVSALIDADRRPGVLPQTMAWLGVLLAIRHAPVLCSPRGVDS